jgi:hypothetical protein
MKKTLESIQDCESLFGSACTNRVLRKRDVLKAVNAGLAECIGLVEVSDEDGGCSSNTVRLGYKLTQSGRDFLAEKMAA